MIKRTLIHIFFLTSLLSVTACGFQPLHSNADGSVDSLRQIAVTEQFDRTGQLIRNEILPITASMASNTIYRLDFSKSETDTGLIESTNTGVNRKSLRLSVDFKLTKLSDGKVVFQGTTFSHVAYDRTSTPFADYQANIDAKERAAKEVGSDIRTRLLAFLKTV